MQIVAEDLSIFQKKIIFTKSIILAKTLVLFAHPFLEFSPANRELIKIYEDHPDFHLKDLYEQFPDLHIPAFRERKRIANYDRFVFHFPLIWFGMPPLLRLWMDEVSDSHWLDGTEPNPFKDKEIYILVTSRNKEESFCNHGKYCYTVEELISGLLVTLKIFKANIKGIFTVFEAEQLSVAQLQEQGEKFLELLKK